jgi:hypothetical protein
MRYLNKIIFINSASVKYAEIELDGNVHLIGTQGVGKSTLLRAILFFYNANKSKLGIPREKKGFDDYYFGYQNSYIIYEVIKDGVAFCVLAYKVNGKVAFRFFNSEYRQQNFLDTNNRAFESWDAIRNSFGKAIHYTALISSYEDFRRIIYGDNSGLNPDFRKYALIESKQYQNIPRTIQNVLLNANLEAKFIKDTIINSLNEEEFVIDIENYSKSHLRGFETQINDIKIWFNTNKKGDFVVKKQAEKIIDKYRIFNFLQREKKDLAQQLHFRIDFIEREKPIQVLKFSQENNVLAELFKKKENLQQTHIKREQDVVSDIKYLTKELAKAKEKQIEYDNQNINEIILKVGKKDSWLIEQRTLGDEKSLLNSKFSKINQKFDALISQVEMQNKEFFNNQNARINVLESEFGTTKNVLFEKYQKLIVQIKADNAAEKAKAINAVQTIIEEENRVKRRKAELKYRSFFATEIDQNKEDKTTLEKTIAVANSTILDVKNKSETTRKEWELETKQNENDFENKIAKEDEKRTKLAFYIEKLEQKIKLTQSSLYGWLYENIPNWQDTIGKVIDEETVLFHTDLHPKRVEGNLHSFFGVELNLNAIQKSVKTVEEYNQELNDFNNKIATIDKKLQQLNADKEATLHKLKTKFKKRLSEFKDTIADQIYKKSQSEEKLKKNSIQLDELQVKAISEKNALLQNLELELEKIAVQKSKTEDQLEVIKNGITRKINAKEREKEAEIAILENTKNSLIAELQNTISHQQEVANSRILELKTVQNSELDHKGADTKRLGIIEIQLSEIDRLLNYISDNERIVIEFDKDKRDLFDKIPQLKADKASLEIKQNNITNEHQLERRKLDEKYLVQKAVVASVKTTIDTFEVDEEKFDVFQKSETFDGISFYFSEEMVTFKEKKSAVILIDELNAKHYKGIETLNELRQSTNAFNGNFSEHNIFSFKLKLNDDEEFLTFAAELKEFIEADKIDVFEKRVNERFASIIRLIGRETTELNSKEAEIEKIIKKINDDFLAKNFVQAIKEMEMRTQKSSNPIVKLLMQIKEFNDQNTLILGASNLFTSSDTSSKNQKAVDLLKQLVKELEKSKSGTLTLSESFDLQFKIVENDNDSGWVEKLSNVGSEGTDVLVKAMINILLLNVFKDSASKKFKDFKLHCMMDEIGRLHPNNVKGILRFANERNILLINGSPTSQNATDYKYTYKLAKEQSSSDTKKYITKINRLVKVNTKVVNL